MTKTLSPGSGRLVLDKKKRYKRAQPTKGKKTHMRQLRAEDSADKHRRAARYHMGACRRALNLSICTTLHQEMDACYKTLRDKTRALEDAEDDLIDFSAQADAAEEAVETTLRDFYQDLGRLDREDPSLNVQQTAFPDGLGDALEPKGRGQLAVIVGLKERLKSAPLQDKIKEGLSKIEQASALLQSALDKEEEAEQKATSAATHESDARKALRQQLNSAHGQLRAFFKANPARAERFFLRESGARRAASTTPATS